MAKLIDAQGRSCPEPVILTRKALASKEDAYEVLVDSPTAAQNVTRFAEQSGYSVAATQNGSVYHLVLHRR